MNSEDQCWVRIWQLIVSVVIVFIFAIGVNKYHSKEVLARMVEAGADPVMARCAVYQGGRSGDVFCALALQQR